MIEIVWHPLFSGYPEKCSVGTSLYGRAVTGVGWPVKVPVRNSWNEVMSCLHVRGCMTCSVTSVFMKSNAASVAGVHGRVLTDVRLTDVPRET